MPQQSAAVRGSSISQKHIRGCMDVASTLLMSELGLVHFSLAHEPLGVSSLPVLDG